jgi:hypothetical protein
MNDMSLSVSNANNPALGITDVPDCVNTFTNLVLNDCDASPDDPYNFKWGGSYFDPTSGWTFIMTAADITDTEDSCSATWDVLFDTFDIRGINFAAADVGQDGSGLKDKLSGCAGDIEDWNFELTPFDIKYQWHATGRTTLIGQRSCIGDVITSIGGNTSGSCSGPG